MKKKTKVKTPPVTQDGCWAVVPAWIKARTKGQAWRLGLQEGITEGRRTAENNMDETRKRLENREKEARLQALRDICQAGSTVVEAMSKALLAYDKCL